MIHHITRATRHLIFWSLIVTAIGLTGVRLLLSEIEHYKTELAVNISELVGVPVTIGRLGAKMRGFNPQLVLKDIALAPTGDEKPTIAFSEIRLGIHLLNMLTSQDVLSSSWVTVVGAKLTIKRQPDGSLVIVGLKASDGQPQWLLQGGKYEVLHSEITWLDETSNNQPLLFNKVDLAICNDGEHHRLNVLMKLPEKIGDSLRLSMDLEGNIFEPASVQGRVYLDGKAVLLAELAAGFGFAQPTVSQPTVSQPNRWLSGAEAGGQIRINAGIGDFKIWADWRHSQLVSMNVSALIKQMTLVRQDKQELVVNQLKTQLHVGMTEDSASNRWNIDVNDFSLDTLEKQWPTAVFSLSGQRWHDNAWHNIALFMEQLDLQEASQLAQFFAPLPDDQAQLLAQAQLQGRLEHFSLFADLDTKTVALNGQLIQMGVAPILSAPGIKNITGRIKGSEKQGVITFASKDAWLQVPDVFRAALPINRLQGTLNWRKAEDTWSLSSQTIALDALGFQSNSRFRIDIPETDKPVFMDLQSSFAGEDASQVIPLLPAGVMGKDTLAWLDHAFFSGKITNGGMLIYGNLKDLPFTNAPGVFEALFNTEQLDLSYAPDWPRITAMDAEVLFAQESLKVTILRGQSDNVTIKQADVTIPSLSTSKQLLVQGELEGGIDHVLAFMQQTPLRSRVDPLLEAITPQGLTQVALDLKIPLVAGAPTKVDGNAQLKDAKLMVKSLALPVNKINGELKFNEHGVYSDLIHATALAHPIQIDIKSLVNQTVVNVTGNAGISDLQAQFDLPWWHIAEGATDYKLKLSLPYGTTTPELLVESMLLGVSLDLPDSLSKIQEQSVPLSLTFSLSDKQLLPVLLNYDNKLKAAIQFDIEKKALYSGHVLIGDGEVTQSQEAGLKFEINRDRLALQDWLGLAATQGAGEIVRELKIHTDHALWKTSDLGVFDLTLKPQGNYWAGTIASPVAKGTILLPTDTKNTARISLDMALLDLSALKQLGSKQATPLQNLSPEQVPLLTIVSHKTLWRSIDLGLLSLATERIPGGISFKQVELIGENQKLVLSGDWVNLPKANEQPESSQSITHMQGHLEVPNIGPLLAQLDVSKDLAETEATLDFTVNWNAAPYQFSLAGLTGQMDIKLSNGRILSIEPGFGRVLGMLALAQWIKRAQLDFSDIYKEGLSFNSIKGHFDLTNGIASTHDLLVDAVPAKIAISGDTDLVKQTVDQLVDVTPKSADAVPIAGTIMGKVMALVGRSLTGKDQEGFFFGSHYRITGAWGNADVIPLHKNDGLLQKTWTGITDFPWLPEQQEKIKEQRDYYE